MVVLTSSPRRVLVPLQVDPGCDLRRTLGQVRRTPGLAVLRTCRPS